MLCNRLFCLTGLAFLAMSSSGFELYSTDVLTVDLYGDVQVRSQHTVPSLSNNLEQFNSNHAYGTEFVGSSFTMTPSGSDVGAGLRQNQLFNTSKYGSGKTNKILGDDSNIGLKIKHQLDEEVYVRGRFELGWEDMASPTVDNGGDSKLQMHYGFVAIGSEKMGEVKLGKMGSVRDAMGKKHDFSHALAGASMPSCKGWQATDVANNALGYEWNGRGVTVMMQGQGDSGKYDTMTIGSMNLLEHPSINHGYGAGVNWDTDIGLSISATYTHVSVQQAKEDQLLYAADRAAPTVDANFNIVKDKALSSDSMSLAAAYTIADFTIAVSVLGNRFMGRKAIRYFNAGSITEYKDLGIKQMGIGLGLRYFFSAINTRVYGIYDQLETKYDTEHALEGAYAPYAISNKDHKEKLVMYTLGVDYEFVNQLRLYMEYAQSKTSNVFGTNQSGMTAKNQVLTIGMRFLF